VSDLFVDVHGLRTFRVSDDGNLLPVIALDDSWRGGVCIAACRRRATHQAPVEGCRCGIYTFRSLPILRAQYEQADQLVAVVALEGQTLSGSRGWRSQAGRVLALWVAPGALPTELHETLVRNLPDVTFHDDVDAMVSHYPDLSIMPPIGRPISPGLARRSPSPVRSVRPGRIPLYILATALLSVVFVVARQESTAGGMWSDIAGLGAYLGSHFQDLFFPVLIVGVWVRVPRVRGPGYLLVSGVLRILIPLCIGAALADLISRGSVGIDPMVFVYFIFISWIELWQFAQAVGRTDGVSGVFARQFLHAVRILWRLLRPSRRGTGVNYSAHLENPLNSYPLIMPVRFEVQPG